MGSAARRVLVLGAQGVLGSVIARTFAQERWQVERQDAARRPGCTWSTSTGRRPCARVRALAGLPLKRLQAKA